MKHAYLLLLAAVMLLTFSACRSTKGLDRTKGHVSGTTVSGTSSTAHADANAVATALVKEITAQPLAPSCLTAKVKVDLEGMGKSISVNGQLRMKRDDVVQLSLTFLGMEVGRMEFTPQDVLIIDRMNKQYVRAAYSARSVSSSGPTLISMPFRRFSGTNSSFPANAMWEPTLRVSACLKRADAGHLRSRGRPN